MNLLPRDVGTVTLHLRPPSERRGPRSYLHDGRCLECIARPGYAVAVDAEAFATPAAVYLGERLGLSQRSFLGLWTRIEVIAKLTGIPAVVLLQRVRAGERLPQHGLVVRTATEGDLVVSAGWARS